MAIKKTNLTAWLINPPGPLYQRGEDRCQANIDASSAISLRAPNDLAYMAAVLRKLEIGVSITDFPAEKLGWQEFERLFREKLPDLLIMSITNATILEDLKAFSIAKRITPDVFTIAKGALFFACDLNLLNTAQFDVMNCALTGESESAIGPVARKLISGENVTELPNIIYKSQGRWFRNPPGEFESDLDTIPFPARDLLKNELYVRPDTGEPQATIQTARGCPSQCVFCLTPSISGSRVRSRSVINIVDELEECVTVHGIRNFFFKADTFTINKKFVIDLCREIIRRNLNIEWVANSRVDTIDEERLNWMKRAGCWLVAFGYESGNDGILKKMKKEATVSDARRATGLVRSAGLRIYGFFMIGLPWDDKTSINETLQLARELDCDFYEIHMATPFEGTELFSMAQSMGLLEDSVVGHNYFSDPAMGSLFLARHEILDLRQKGLRSLYLRPSYIAKTISHIRTPRELSNYARYGARLVKNMIFPA